MKITDGKAEVELRGVIRELEREVRTRTGAVYAAALLDGDFAAAREKLAPVLAAVRSLAEVETPALDAVKEGQA